MKKIISVLFAASLMFVIFACAPKTEAPAEEAVQEEQVQEETVEVSDDAAIQNGEIEEQAEN